MNKYIVIEGIDGSGKTTLAKAISDQLGLKLIKEPSDTNLGNAIRELSKEYGDNLEVMSNLFAADRCLQMDKIKSYLQYTSVISDRSIFSSVAYQTKCDIIEDSLYYMIHNSLIRHINKLGNCFCTPDLLIYLDLPPSVALNRINKNRSDTHEHFEKISNLEKSYNIYKLMLRESIFFTRTVSIDATLDQNKILSIAIEEINKLYK